MGGLLTILLSACASSPTPDPLNAANTLFCDNYFIYAMCAKDLDGNGEVDIMYFEDTNEVFMAQNTNPQGLPDPFSQHRCMQVMDDSLQKASNALLGLTENSSSIQRTKIKTRMILNYSRYLSTINSCNDPDYVAHTKSNDDDFGDEDFEEL